MCLDQFQDLLVQVQLGPLEASSKKPHHFRQSSKACIQLGIKSLPPILSMDSKSSLKSPIMSQGNWWVLANSIKKLPKL